MNKSDWGHPIGARVRTSVVDTRA